MVFFELAAAKGATAFSGCLKLAATGSSGVAVAVAGPPPGVHDPGPPLTGDGAPVVPKISPELRPLLSWAERDAAHMGHGDAMAAAPWGPKPGELSQVDFLPFAKMELVKAAKAPVPGHVAAMGMLETQLANIKAGAAHFLDMVVSATSAVDKKACISTVSAVALAVKGLRFVDNMQEQQEQNDRAALPFVVEPCLRFVVVVDAMTLGAVINSVGVDLVAPLRTWACGCAALSFPTTWFVDQIVKRYGLKFGFVTESFMVGFSMFWLTWGTHLVCMYPELADAAPALYYIAFANTMLAWSTLSAGTVILIISSVLSVMSNFHKPMQ